MLVNAERYRQSEARDNSNLIDLLVAVVIGVIGGFIAFQGLHLDNKVIYLVGMAILVSLAFVTIAKMISSIFELISTILYFKNHFRNRHP